MLANYTHSTLYNHKQKYQSNRYKLWIHFSITEVIRNIYRAKVIKIEVYEYLVLWNPNDHAGYDPSIHPNPNGVRILKTVQNIGRSLMYLLYHGQLLHNEVEQLQLLQEFDEHLSCKQT